MSSAAQSEEILKNLPNYLFPPERFQQVNDEELAWSLADVMDSEMSAAAMLTQQKEHIESRKYPAYFRTRSGEAFLKAVMHGVNGNDDTELPSRAAVSRWLCGGEQPLLQTVAVPSGFVTRMLNNVARTYRGRATAQADRMLTDMIQAGVLQDVKSKTDMEDIEIYGKVDGPSLDSISKCGTIFNQIGYLVDIHVRKLSILAIARSVDPGFDETAMTPERALTISDAMDRQKHIFNPVRDFEDDLPF